VPTTGLESSLVVSDGGSVDSTYLNLAQAATPLHALAVNGTQALAIQILDAYSGLSAARVV